MLKVLVAAVCVLCFLPLGLARASQTNALASLTHASNWVNGKLSQSDVSGKVVLVDFYTFACINCKHTEPNLRSLYQNSNRRDLIIVGVHSPETSYEKDRDNLLASLKDQGIVWPVAVDNDFAVWNSYSIQAWPTQLIFDRHGKLRATVVGEGQDELVNQTIKQLIAER